jgi:phenylalanyl-tRNA synthetase alpha chain
VTQSLGVDVPVAAWGIGIDRMALMALGLNDLRELFRYEIEDVRLRRARFEHGEAVWMDNITRQEP